MSSIGLNRVPLTFEFDGKGTENLPPLSIKVCANRDHCRQEQLRYSLPFTILTSMDQLEHTHIKLKNVKLEKGEDIPFFKYREFKRCFFTPLSNAEQLTNGAKEALFKKCNLNGKLSFKNVKHLCFDRCTFSDVTFSGSNIDTITFSNSNIHSSSKNESLHQREKRFGEIKGLLKIKRLELIGNSEQALDLKYFHFLLKKSQAKSVLIKDFIINGAFASLPQSLKKLEINQCTLNSPRTFHILHPGVQCVKLTEITANGKQLTIADSVQSIFLKTVPFNSFKLPNTLNNLTLVDMDLKGQCKKLPNIQGQLVLKECSLTLKDLSILKNRFSEWFSLVHPHIVDAPRDGISIKNIHLADFPLEKIKPTDQWIRCKKVQLDNAEDRLFQFKERAFQDCSFINANKEKLLQGGKLIHLWNVDMQGLIPLERGASCQLSKMNFKKVSLPNTRLKEITIHNSSLDGILSFPNTDSLGFYSCLGLKGVLPLIKKPLKKLTINSTKQFTLDCSKIPKGLKELSIYDISIDSGTIGSLPSSLKKLYLDRIKGGPIDCSKLPKGIETLNLSSITINSKDPLLPPSTKHLTLSRLSLKPPLASPFPIQNNFHSLHIGGSSICKFLCFTTKSVPNLRLSDFAFEKIPLHARSNLPSASKQLALSDSSFSLCDLKALMGTSIEFISFHSCELRLLPGLPEFLSKYPQLKQVTIKYSNIDREVWNRLKAPIALRIENSQGKKLSIIQNI